MRLWFWAGIVFPLVRRLFISTVSRSQLLSSWPKRYPIAKCKNVYVEKGLATAETIEIERVGKNKIGMLGQFYEMKMDL